MTTRVLSRTAQSSRRYCFTSLRFYSKQIIRENDVVLLQRRERANAYAPILTTPLIPNKTIVISRDQGAIKTEDIIGKGFRSVVNSTKGIPYRIHQPTLGEYTNLAPRIVTPIYAQDANLIVSLLDLHPTTPEVNWAQDNSKLEIFEAGTGHGALTLHLSRAIHGANIRPPRRSDYNLDVASSSSDPNPSTVARKLEMVRQYAKARGNSPPQHIEESDRVFDHCIADYIKVAGELGARIEFSLLANKAEYPPWIQERFRKLADSDQELPEQDMDVLERIYKREYDAWRSGRRAVIHTLDNNGAHSKYAEKTVRNYRQGMYFHNVDFHIGSIRNYITSRLEETDQEVFLDHAILDLPGTDTYMELIGKALKPDGSLITWNPSIGQVIDCVNLVREQKLPFVLERVLETIGGMNGGREWDVRRMRLRATNVKSPVVEEVEEATGSLPEENAEPDEDSVPQESIDSAQPVVVDDSRYEMVCRPKAGSRVFGGGFISVWKRMEQRY